MVEDSAMVARPLRRALERYFSQSKYEIEIYESAEAALDQVQTRPIAVLISDLRLPGMNGLELIKRVRQSTPGTPSILMTAFGSSHIEERANEQDIVYLPKPFDLSAFIATVQELLGD
jgi:DNA-binding NtrC family response regulator